MRIKPQIRAKQRKMSLFLLIISDNGLKGEEFYSCPLKLECTKSKSLDPEQRKDKAKNDRVDYSRLRSPS